MAEITPDSRDGRVLLALRAGPMAAAELYDRVPAFSPSSLQRHGLIERLPEDCYRITAAGRAACPLRNPLAATVAPPPSAALNARRAGLPPLRPSQPVPTRAKPAKPDQPPSGEAMENITFNPKKDTLSASRAGVFYALKGIDREHAITRQELALRGPASVESGALFNALQRMAQEGLVGAFGSTTARRYYDLRTKDADLREPCADSQTGADPTELAPFDARTKGQREASHRRLQLRHEATESTAKEALAEAVSAPVSAPRPAAPKETPPVVAPPPADEVPEIEFAIYDDGRLAIFDGDELMTLPPEATRRLGYFLGCLEIHAWPPRLDPEVLDPEATHL